MKTSIRTTLAVAAGAVLAAGCAAGPYHPDYGYGAAPGYYYDYGPSYYAGPSVGLGYTYIDRDDRRRWRHERDGRRDWRDGRHDGVPVPAPTPDSYTGPRNHAGEAIGPGYRPPPGSESPG